MAFKFEELKVWQISLRLSNEIDIIAKNFPKIELFSLSNQLKKPQIQLTSILRKAVWGNRKPNFQGS